MSEAIQRSIRTVVAGIDSVHEPGPLLDQAIAFAARLGAELHLVHGFLASDPLLDAYVQAGYFDQRTITALRDDLEAALIRAIRERSSSERVHARVVAGPVATTILEAAQETGADLILVGASRHTRFPRSLLGNTCRSVLRRAGIPVLMVRPDHELHLGRLLAAIDLSENSRQAFEFGCALVRASEKESELRAVLVIDESLLLLPVEQRLLDRVAAEELGEFIEQLPMAEGEVETAIRRGYPASELLSEAGAWNADLIVLGTHGRTGMERILLGSVAEGVMRSAPCHVLAVPER